MTRVAPDIPVSPPFKPQGEWLYPGGGALTLERGMGMCRGHDPLFQTSRRSLAHQFTVNAPLLCPLFSIFRKFLHFQPCFGQNSSSLDPKFSKFSFSRPPFFKENPLPRLYILKPAWHTPTKKKLRVPPPGGSMPNGNVLPNCLHVGPIPGTSSYAYCRACLFTR